MWQFDTPLQYCFHLKALLILLTAFGQSNVTEIRASQEPPEHLKPGSNFAKGSIDFGGLIVTQSSTFRRIWTMQGGTNDQGATFYEPSTLSDGYFILGHYSHDNNKKLLDGRVILVKDNGTDAVAKPLSYTLLWKSKNLDNNHTDVGYVWEPVAPKGYTALGHIVTTSPEMPSLEKVRVVRSDFVKECSNGELIWGEGVNGVNLYEGKSESSVGLAPAESVPVGTFKAALSDKSNTTPVHCLKNSKIGISISMPNMDQIKNLMATYGPLLYLHPDEIYFPASTFWFFTMGALLYQLGNESNPVLIDPIRQKSNLPQGGYNDGAYWIDLPVDENDSEFVKKGDLKSAQGYLHIRPMQGGIVTDIAIWIFFPFNGPARIRVLGLTFSIGRIGSHVGDWEHITLRISNLDGKLQSIFFGEHHGGQWISASELEYAGGTKPIVYSALNGHAMYPHGGLVLDGNKFFGFRNDMAKSGFFIDLGSTILYEERYEIVSADYLNVTEPPWLNFARPWGPKVVYRIRNVLMKFRKALIFRKLKEKFEDFVNWLPKELLGEVEPVGPKMKPSWIEDE